MTYQNKMQGFEVSRSAEHVPGRELEYFVWLLWKGKPSEAKSYASTLIRKGFKPYVLTLTAAESYFPFVNDNNELSTGAKKIAETFSHRPFYWGCSFCIEDKFKSKGRK